MIVTATVVSATPPAPPPPPPPVRKVRTSIAARSLKPGNRSKALVLFNNAFSLQRQDKVADAISEYTKAVATDPSFPKAYYNLAIAYGSIGQTERAMDNYELALMADPNLHQKGPSGKKENRGEFLLRVVRLSKPGVPCAPAVTAI